jgi:hypothetical protein
MWKLLFEFISKTETDYWKTRDIAFRIVLVETLIGARTFFVDRRKTYVV